MIGEFDRGARMQQILAELAQRQAVGKELRGKIVRASSWSQLFATPAEAEADYLREIVEESRKAQESINMLQEYRVDADPNGDIHSVTRKDGHNTRMQRLPNGDVVLEFSNPNDPTHRNLITAAVGNIDHPFSVANTVGPDVKTVINLNQGIGTPEYEEMRARIGIDPMTFIPYLRGKPAITAWEDIMLENGHLPQRIGHRIFPHFVLEAQAKFAAAYPHLMPGSPKVF